MKQVFNPLTGHFNLVLDNAVEADMAPIVTQDSFTVYDNAGAPAAGDGHVKLAMDLAFATVPRVIANQSIESNPGFLFSASSKMLILPNYFFGSASVTFPDFAVTTEPPLRIMPCGVNGGALPTGILVYNGGGAGNHKQWQDSVGNSFPVYDLGTFAEVWPTCSRNPMPYLAFEAPSFFADGLVVYDCVGRNALEFQASADIANEDLFVNAAAASPDDLIVQASGGDLTVPASSTVEQGNVLNQFWLPIYHKSSAAIDDRWQHDGAGQLMMDIYVSLGSNGFIKITYNANASTEGEEVLYSNGNGRFESDIGANSAVGVCKTLRPHQVTK